MKKLLTSIVLLAVCAISIHAQMVGSSANYDRSKSQQSNNHSDSFGGFSIYAGGAFPMGNYKAGKMTDNVPADWALLFTDGNKGYAGIGYNIGWDALIPVSRNGLGIFLGMDYFFNGHNKDIKAFISDYNDVIDKAPKVHNITPLMFGLRYLGSINKNFGIFVEVGGGPNIRLISKMELSFTEVHYGDYYEINETLNYDPALTFAFKVGAGMMIARHLSLGVDFYSLGSAQVKGKDEYNIYSTFYGSESGSETFKTKDLECAELVLRLGCRF